MGKRVAPQHEPCQQEQKEKADRRKCPDDDPKNELLLGDDPENHLVLPFVKHLANDQRYFWTAPAHLQKKDFEVLAPFAGITAGFIAGDSWISKQIPLGKVQTSKTISNYGVYSLIGAGAGSFLMGHITGNDRMSEAGLLSGDGDKPRPQIRAQPFDLVRPDLLYRRR